MIILLKDFEYTKDLSAISCCNKTYIYDIISMSKYVRENTSKILIKFKIITLLYIIYKKHIDLKKSIYNIEELADEFQEEYEINKKLKLYNHIISIHDSIDNNMLSISKDIIYISIYLYIQKNNEFLKYFEKLYYNLIYPFKLTLFRLDTNHVTDWFNIFEFDEFDYTERINLFVHHSCGLRYSDTYYPFSEENQVSKEYNKYMEELENDIHKL